MQGPRYVGLVEQRPFGRSGLQVSVQGLGAGHIGGPDQTLREAVRVLDAALDLGINFVDTARGYGQSEERIGRWLGAHRSGIVISTKVGYDIAGEDDWSRGAVVGGVDEALRTLRTDVLDVVFLHSCDLDTLQRGEAIEALLACQQSGKVRVAGYSGENEALAWAVASGNFGAVQTSVNIVDQASLHHTLRAAAEQGLGVVAKRPLANVAWRHRERPAGVYGVEYWDRLQAAGLQPYEGDWTETAARFAAFAPGVSTAIVGTSSPRHLAEAAVAVEKGSLPKDEIRRWYDAYRVHNWPGDV